MGGMTPPIRKSETFIEWMLRWLELNRARLQARQVQTSQRKSA